MHLFYNGIFAQNKLIIFYLPYSKLLGVLFKLDSDCNSLQCPNCLIFTTVLQKYHLFYEYPIKC